MTLFYLIFLAAAWASYAVAGCFKIALVAHLGLLGPLAHQDHLLHNQLLPTNTHTMCNYYLEIYIYQLCENNDHFRAKGLSNKLLKLKDILVFSVPV